MRRHLSHNTSGTIIDSPTEHFEILNADLFTKEGKLHLIIIDELSRHIWFVPGVNQSNTAKYLKSFFLQHGIPKKLITDNGREFKNKTLTQTCEQFGIRIIPIAAYHPESNSVCERVIGTVKTQLEKTNNLEEDIFNYNHSTHSTTKRTPVSLLYGVQEKIAHEPLDRIHEIEINRQTAIENINKSKRVNKALVDSRQTHSKQFQIGDKIQLRMFVEKKAIWSDATYIRTINQETKTITAHIGNREFRRHFNQIRHYTENLLRLCLSSVTALVKMSCMGGITAQQHIRKRYGIDVRHVSTSEAYYAEVVRNNQVVSRYSDDCLATNTVLEDIIL